jgi:hypothetical protein
MQAISITWRGQAFTIPAHKAFQIGEQVEDIATLAQMAAWQHNPQFYKIARCYGAMLRFAGGKATDEEIHSEMMRDIKAAQAAGTKGDLFYHGAILQLMAVLMDGMPEMPAEPDGGSGKPGKKKTAS